MLNPRTTLAIVLGVSECPRAPQLEPLLQCKNSAEDFATYLRTGLGFSEANIINLFDSNAAASDQLGQIEDWLSKVTQSEAKEKPTDLIVYYTGHGGFSRNDQSYFLAVHRTRAGSEGATSIRYVDLASSIKRYADTLRKYLILDCCFAAAAVMRMQSDISQMVVQRVEDELPPSGTAVLCSSAAKLVSIAPPGERHTMFSGALLQLLRDGVPSAPRTLTLEDVGRAAREIIRKKFPSDAVRPELHVPDQSRGNPARVPLFPNLGWVESTAGSDSDRREAWVTAESKSASYLGDKVNTFLGRAAVGVICGLLTTILCAFFEYPFGMAGKTVDRISFPPIAPALSLMLGTALVLRFARTDYLKLSALVGLAMYPASAVAFSAAFFLTLAGVSLAGLGRPSYVVAFAVAGFVGAFLLNTVFKLRGLLIGERVSWAFVVQSSILPLITGAIAVTPIVAQTERSFTSFSIMLGLFVPWQASFLTTMAVAERPHAFISRRMQLFGIVTGSIILVLFLLPSAIRMRVDQLGGPPPPSIQLSVKDAKVVTNAGEKLLAVRYVIQKNISGALSCDLEVRSPDRLTEKGASSENTVEDALTGRSTNFVVPVDTDPANAQARLVCSDLNIWYTTSWRSMEVQVN